MIFSFTFDFLVIRAQQDSQHNYLERFKKPRLLKGKWCLFLPTPIMALSNPEPCADFFLILSQKSPNFEQYAAGELRIGKWTTVKAKNAAFKSFELTRPIGSTPAFFFFFLWMFLFYVICFLAEEIESRFCYYRTQNLKPVSKPLIEWWNI
jgi:hypothetical protein